MVNRLVKKRMSKMKENDMMMVIGEESEQITNCKFCLGERE